MLGKQRPRFFLLALVAFCGVILAHQYHAALSNIERDEHDALEIEHRLFMHDLEPVLLQLNNDKIDLDSAAGEALIRRYIESHFGIESGDGKLITLQWVGLELDQTYATVYQEAAAVPALKTLIYRNQLLAEISTQVNTVNLIDGSERVSLVFQAGRAKSTWPQKE